MAYSDYGAFVYRNGERRKDKEDAPAFASSQETFGEDINNIPSGHPKRSAYLRQPFES